MNEIWANRLIAGTKMWDEVPQSRKESVKIVLAERVESGAINPERFEEITGEDLPADNDMR